MQRYSRRTLLSATAITAGAVMLAGCTGAGSKGNKPGSGAGAGTGTSSANSSKKGDITTASPRPATIQESPALKGKGLPAVEDRIPKNPYVIPHRWTGPGKYGGKLNMPVFGTTGTVNASSIAEFFYGSSPLRYLNDGLDVGPGLVDRWESNDDASVWTLHFREGLRWSDGELFSVDDVLFWWEDIVLPGHDAQTVPPSNVSASGKLVTTTKQDASTPKMAWDTPQPLLPSQLATYVKGAGGNGPIWVLPKHYLKQFHPKYNKQVPKNWDVPGGLWEQKADWKRNPDFPTLKGYRCKKFDNNTGVTLERNPFYYVVNTNGDQLPYIDEIQFQMQQKAETILLQIEQGSVDYCHGRFNQLSLGDVSTLSKKQDQGNYDIVLWNTGSGTGDMFFFNYDYIAQDPKYGKLIRDKRLIRAISYGWDRKTTQKNLYFGTGELTTGTVGPPTTEFHAKPTGTEIYQQWRDSYVSYDIAKAKSLLAELGLKDTNGDGFVEFSDGSRLTIQIPYSADIGSDGAAKDDQLVADMKKIGLRMRRVPISPSAYSEQWVAGKLMTHTNWEASNGGTILAAADWIVPTNNTYWAPLEATWFLNTGTGKNAEELDVEPIKRHPPRMKPEPGGLVDQLITLYNQAIAEPDGMKRNQLVWKMMRLHVDEGPIFLGSTANYQAVTTKNRDLANVPTTDNLALGGAINTWYVPSPAMYDPECYFWTNPEEHSR